MYITHCWLYLLLYHAEKQQTTMLIQCYLFILFIYICIKKLTKDEVIASYTIHIGITWMYLLSVSTRTITQTLSDNVVDMLLSYYIFDTHRLFYTNLAEKWTFAVHHAFALVLLLGYRHCIIPMKVGITFLTLFETSNVFLQWYTLASKKHWPTVKRLTSIPLVMTYVPIRGVAIPFASISFMRFIAQLPFCYMLPLGFSTVTLNMFSMYYAWYIGSKFLKYVFGPLSEPGSKYQYVKTT